MTGVPKPIAMTDKTVTVSRAAWKKIVERLEVADDRAAVRASLARKAAGKDDALPVALYRRIRAGEHPVRIWREHRGFGLNALARRAGVSAPYLCEIENGAKPGSAAALKKLATALAIDMDELV